MREATRRHGAPRALVALTLLALAAGLGQAPAAQAQHATPDGSVPDVPAGDGAIRVRLVHAEGPAKTEGATLVLYALAADGRPGVRSATLDAGGAHVFEKISTASSTVYLIGARYRSIPYGQRVQFQPGQTHLEVEIEVADPSGDASALRVGESSLRVEWIGASLAVEEVHELHNPGTQAVFIEPDQRAAASPPFRTELLLGATSLNTNLGGLGDGFERRGSQLLYWGPVYAGKHEVRFRYLVPARPGEPLVWQPSLGSERARLLFPDTGLSLRGEGLTASEDVTVDGRTYRSLDAGALAAGDSLRIDLSVPETRRDAGAIRMPRVDVWLELDDTFLQVTVDHQIEVSDGPHLAGTAEAPLLRFQLPPDAELRGLSPDAQNLGLVPGAAGMDLIGPLAPGQASLSYRYRVPAGLGATPVVLGFPAEVALLNVRIADTGILIETDRLHRRRPFRSGTRVYLHREAFNVTPDESLALRLTPLERNAATRRQALIATTAGAALGIWFIFAPLAGRRVGAVPDEAELAEDPERQRILESIRDLDHDFETGKVERGHYEAMRRELRGQAVALLKQERDREAPPPAVPPASAAMAQAPASDAVAAANVRFCPSCGAAADAGWSFCAGCGTALPASLPGESEA